jgi:hypothetical protein
VWGGAVSVSVVCRSGGGLSNAAAAALVVIMTCYGIVTLVLAIMYRYRCHHVQLPS